MACLNDCPKFNVDNEYYTKKKMWENIIHLIPKDKTIYEMCLLNSNSKSIEYMKELGIKNVVGDKSWDCLTFKPIKYDMIITNIPFETNIKKKILTKLVEIDKPFIIILNSMNIYSKYFRDIFGDNLKYLQIIIPLGKIKFEKYNVETEDMEKLKDPSFYCCYLAYKMNIPQEELWLK
tara:strand:- start:38 stop:571 length:534 start_codon:yes stop_codon:yes gene_type:complete